MKTQYTKSGIYFSDQDNQIHINSMLSSAVVHFNLKICEFSTNILIIAQDISLPQREFVHMNMSSIHLQLQLSILSQVVVNHGKYVPLF